MSNALLLRSVKTGDEYSVFGRSITTDPNHKYEVNALVEIKTSNTLKYKHV